MKEKEYNIKFKKVSEKPVEEYISAFLYAHNYLSPIYALI